MGNNVNAMSADRFIDLVEKHNGFEFSLAYRDDADHIIGGKGDTYWYIIVKKGKVAESYIGKCQNGSWEDTYIKGTGARKKTKAMPSGSTIALIAEKAYYMQNEKWVAGKKNPRLIEDSHPHYHYVYGFGDKGLDVSEKYGVTIAYSDIKDAASGFHLSSLQTGNDVEMP